MLDWGICHCVGKSNSVATVCLVLLLKSGLADAVTLESSGLCTVFSGAGGSNNAPFPVDSSAPQSP